MAIMCPEKPKKFSKYSFEDVAFNALEQLPDDYYVFHSFSIVGTDSGAIDESEVDFVIFNARLGVMCVEAKAGRPEYRNRTWYYGSGIPMSHDGPFRQASSNKHRIMDLLVKQGYYEKIVKHCKFVHAVWFISINDHYFDSRPLPQEAKKELILTADSIDCLKDRIETIFNLETRVETKLDQNGVNILLNQYLAPEFNAISISEYRIGHERRVFKSLLKEQIALLNYLDEQPDAIVNGLAGTGKTIMAVEKARRHANRGDKVLFLCYNAKLKTYLREAYGHDNIDFYTIDGFACEQCGTSVADYYVLREVLENYYYEQSFPYKHVIIDEGQDFGRDELTGQDNQSEIDIIDLLRLLVLGEDRSNGSFYLFYDKNQMVQSHVMPDFISNADCKLTLYRNCRNTKNIAETSIRLLNSETRVIVREGTINGNSPVLGVCDNKEKTLAYLNYQLDHYWENGLANVQILTCKTMTSTLLASELYGEFYRYKGVQIPMTTCRKFKGLEADAIILVDMDFDLFSSRENKVFYVGASRARHELTMLANLTEEECIEILEMHEKKAGKNIEKKVAALFNAKLLRI